MKPYDVTNTTFEAEVLKSEKPVIVDFWAEWCQPCKMIAPALEELAQDFADKAKIVKVNIDENNETAMLYGVRSIPTLLVFKDGQPAATHVGALPKGRLKEWIEQSL